MISNAFFTQGSMKYPFLFFLLVSYATLLPTGYAQSSKQLHKIVLDAGHGGSDIGAPKYKLAKNEKDITLDIVLKLGRILKDSIPDLKVIYTRTTDIYPKLQERHEIAYKANADLFVSIHVNSTAGRKTRIASGYHYVGKGKKRRKVRSYKTVTNRETKAQGTESYVLGLHRNSQKGKAIEDYGDNVTEEPGLLDENDPTTQIMVAQYTQAFLSRSINFASKVEDNFTKTGRNSYGVKQKGLEVLAGSAMPGVLIEVGFINNPDDEQYLNSQAGQAQVALSIYRAIKSYKEDLNRGKAK